jgi:hypothetical protein
MQTSVVQWPSASQAWLAHEVPLRQSAPSGFGTMHLNVVKSQTYGNAQAHPALQFSPSVGSSQV